MIYYLKFGKTVICIKSPFKIEWDNDMQQFLITSHCKPVMTYHFIVTHTFTPIHGKIVYQTTDCTFLVSNNKEYRIYTLTHTGEPYAYSFQADSHNYHIYMYDQIIPYIKGNRNIFNYLALDKVLIENQSIVLHSSYIVHNDKAILFSASSGVGKSTQANLWNQIKGSKIINGDRTLLSFEDKQWYACGFPICGSSQICHNEKHPINTIVFLKQNTQNIISTISTTEKTKLLYEQLFISIWDSEIVNNSISIIDSIISNVRIIQYACTKDESAVLDLFDYINN